MSLAAYNCRHGVFVHDEDDRVIGRSLRLFGEWAEEEIYLLSKLINCGDTVLDIGANVGTHAVAMSRIVGRNGIVVAVDGHSAVSSILATNLILNDVNNVLRIEAFIGDETKVVYDKRKKEDLTKIGDIWFGDISERSVNEGLTRPATMFRVDSLRLDSCALIKIDIEGMEFASIRGSIETILEFNPYIYFEQANNDNFSNIYDLFDKLRYDLYSHVCNPFNVRNYNKYRNNFFGGATEVNILAVPKFRSFAGIDGVSLTRITASDWQRPSIVNPLGWSLPHDAYANLAPILQKAAVSFL